MKKVITAGAVCALAVAAVVTPSVMGVKSTKQVASSVTVNATPNPVVAGAPATGSGNVSSNSSCRKDRTVGLEWVDASSVATPAGSAVTKSNGSYAAALTAPAVAGAYTLRATVQGPVIRKVGSKKKGKKNKKGRRFSCNASLPTSTGPLTVTPGV